MNIRTLEKKKETLSQKIIKYKEKISILKKDLNDAKVSLRKEKNSKIDNNTKKKIGGGQGHWRAVRPGSIAMTRRPRSELNATQERRNSLQQPPHVLEKLPKLPSSPVLEKLPPLPSPPFLENSSPQQLTRNSSPPLPPPPPPLPPPPPPLPPPPPPLPPLPQKPNASLQKAPSKNTRTKQVQIPSPHHTMVASTQTDNHVIKPKIAATSKKGPAPPPPPRRTRPPVRQTSPDKAEKDTQTTGIHTVKVKGRKSKKEKEARGAIGVANKALNIVKAALELKRNETIGPSSNAQNPYPQEPRPPPPPPPPPQVSKPSKASPPRQVPKGPLGPFTAPAKMQTSNNPMDAHKKALADAVAKRKKKLDEAEAAK